MAGRSVDSILKPKVILREVSRLALPGTVLSDLWGWGLTARDPSSQSRSNTIDYDLRSGQYDVFDSTRTIASGRVPGTASSRQKPQKVGVVNFTIPRSAETIELSDEDLVNRRQIGEAVTVLDARGETYVRRQQRYMAQRVANMIEMQTAAMLRGGRYTFDTIGDELRQGFSGGEVTIDYRVDQTENIDQLSMGTGGDIIDAAWATASTDIPLHLFKINAAFNDLVGRGLEHAVCNHTVWNSVVNNTKVAAQGGSANIVFESISRRGPGEFSAVLRSIPWLTWHVIDYSLNTWNGSSFDDRKLIEDDKVAFFPEPDSQIAQYMNGAEMVTEGPAGVRQFRHGFYPYAYPSHDPSGWNMTFVHNGIPALYNPNALAYGDVS